MYRQYNTVCRCDCSSNKQGCRTLDSEVPDENAYGGYTTGKKE